MGREGLRKFHSVEPVAPVAKRAEPLKAVSLTDDRAGPYHLPALAPPVAWSTDVIQSAKGSGHFFGLGQSALACSLTRAINIKDYPRVSNSIRHPTHLLLGREWATEQIIEKERAQGCNGRFGQRC